MDAIYRTVCYTADRRADEGRCSLERRGTLLAVTGNVGRRERSSERRETSSLLSWQQGIATPSPADFSSRVLRTRSDGSRDLWSRANAHSLRSIAHPLEDALRLPSCHSFHSRQPRASSLRGSPSANRATARATAIESRTVLRSEPTDRTGRAPDGRYRGPRERPSARACRVGRRPADGRSGRRR